MRSSIILFLLFATNLFSFGQEEKSWKDHFAVSGYVKYMNTSSFASLDSVVTDNLYKDSTVTDIAASAYEEAIKNSQRKIPHL